MGEFLPFPIRDAQAGEFAAAEPWRAPAETWDLLENAYVYRGVVRTRLGSTLWGRLTPKATQTFAGTAGETNLSGTIANVPVVPAEDAPSDYAVRFFDGAAEVAYVTTEENVSDPVSNKVRRTSDDAEVGVFVSTTGDFLFNLPVALGNDLSVEYEYERDETVRGVFSFKARSGGEFLVALDETRIYLWRDGAGRWDDLLGADTYNTTGNARWWFAPFQDVLIFTNGIDRPQVYEPLNGNTVRDLVTLYDPAGPREILTAEIVLNHKDQLLLANVTEDDPVLGTVQYPQRVHRTNVNDFEGYATPLQFNDAPTDRTLITAVEVGDDPIFGFDGGETWKYRYRGEATQFPYSWQRISGFRGADAKHGSVELERTALMYSRASFVETDGNDVADIDLAIPDEAEKVDSARYGDVFAQVVNERDQVWWSLPDIGVLVLNFKTGAWSRYTLDHTCFGLYRNQSEILWDDVGSFLFGDADAPWDLVELTPNEVKALSAAGAPVILAGGPEGKVFALDRGVTDDGAAFTVRMRTQRLTFFPEQRSRLGWLNLVTSRHDGQTARVSFFRDWSAASYLDVDLDLTGEGDAQTIRHTISVNQIAALHQIEITATSVHRFGVHAVEPWASAEGMVRRLAS